MPSFLCLGMKLYAAGDFGLHSIGNLWSGFANLNGSDVASENEQTSALQAD